RSDGRRAWACSSDGRPTAVRPARGDSSDAGPLFSFGLVADVQYADRENGMSKSTGNVKQYRATPGLLGEAVGKWLQRADTLDFVLNLGDTIDGNETDEGALHDLEVVAEVFDRLGNIKAHHVLGNHCLAAPRDMLLQRLGMPHAYYTADIAPGWRLVTLDTTEMSNNSRYPQCSYQHVESIEFAQTHPPNLYPYMTSYNGGISSVQMRWLRSQLQSARANSERVVIACHHPVGQGSCRPTHMAWNCVDIQEAIVSSGVVPLVLSGHDHPGGYARNQDTHFVTLHGMLEAPSGSTAFAVVNVFPDAIEFEGYGVVPCRKLGIPKVADWSASAARVQ
ncbi:unnamed protein product, partial [Ostreobium quekettii]